MNSDYAMYLMLRTIFTRCVAWGFGLKRVECTLAWMGSEALKEISFVAKLSSSWFMTMPSVR